MEQTIDLNQSEETTTMTGYEFITACAMGQLETAKQLLVENPEIITTKQYMQFGIRQACYSGNLNIADWILSVNPDIENLDEELEKFPLGKRFPVLLPHAQVAPQRPLVMGERGLASHLELELRRPLSPG